MSMGCVIKNHDNEVIIAASKMETILVDPGLAEVLAIRWGLHLACELNLEWCLCNQMHSMFLTI